jgi:hypothetical protein
MSAIGSGRPFIWPTDDDLTLLVEIHQIPKKEQNMAIPTVSAPIPIYPPTSPEFPALESQEKIESSPILDKPAPKLPGGGINYCW